MYKNVLIAYTDSDNVFVSLSTMQTVYAAEYSYDKRHDESTVTIMTNPLSNHYIDDDDDGIYTLKHFRKAWNTFVDAITHKEVGKVYFENFDETGLTAFAHGPGFTMWIKYMFECGWSVNIEDNYFRDEKYENYEEFPHIQDAIAYFKKIVEREHLEAVIVPDWLNDEKQLKETDDQHDAYQRQEAYYDACIASEYGDDSLMNRYNRNYGIEKDYGPSNPWDAPGMSVADFI